MNDRADWLDRDDLSEAEIKVHMDAEKWTPVSASTSAIRTRRN
jgi:hypothetical protein